MAGLGTGSAGGEKIVCDASPNEAEALSQAGNDAVNESAETRVRDPSINEDDQASTDFSDSESEEEVGSTNAQEGGPTEEAEPVDEMQLKRERMAEFLKKMSALRQQLVQNQAARADSEKRETEEQDSINETRAVATESNIDVATPVSAVDESHDCIRRAPVVDDNVVEGAQEKAARMLAMMESLSAASDPNERRYNFQMSAMKKYEEADYAGAADDWQEVLSLDRDDADAWCNCGQAKYRFGDHEGAIRDFTESLRQNSDRADVYFVRGSVKSDMGDDEGAIADFCESLRLDPGCVEVWGCRGTANLMRGDFSGATDDCTAAIKLDSNYAGAWGVRGTAKLRMGDHVGAAEDCTKALALDENLTWVQPTLEEAQAMIAQERSSGRHAGTSSRSLSHRDRGNVLFKDGSLRDAVAAYQQAYEGREEGWVLALSNQAICHLKLAEHAEAVAIAELCLEQKGAPLKAHLTKFKALAAMHDWERAFAAMQELRAQPDLPPDVQCAAEKEEALQRLAYEQETSHA